jgi:hypothetical protein
MEINTIVTLEDNSKYYLADETYQNGKKYFLGNKLDENEEPTDVSEIFEENLENGDTYLDIIDDPELLKSLGTIFTANFSNMVDETEEA